MRSKGELRKELAARRNALAPERVEDWSATICERVLSDSLVAGADVLLCHASKGNEVATRQIIQSFIGSGNRILLPAITGTTESRVMEWLPVHDITDLRAGTFGLLEPTASGAPPSPPPPGAPVIVPGLAFTTSGQRLGRGGGYYDVFLASHSGPRIALAYELQIVTELPLEAHDIRMDAIVTERRWVDCKECS